MLSSKTINWLSQKQELLDNYIKDKKQFQNNQEILDKKLVAFFTEIAEFANEERSFKYWSEKPASTEAIQLSEYVDGIHFLISIGNQIGYDFKQWKYEHNLDSQGLVANYFKIINKLSNFLQENSNTNYEQLLNSYLEIIETNNFTEEKIIDAYNQKNQINFERQNQNY